MVVEFGTTIDQEINATVHRLAASLKQEFTTGIDAVVPTYRSLMIYFNPLQLSRDEVKQQVEIIYAKVSEDAAAEQQSRVVYSPTCYGGEFGPDLPFVASHTGLDADEVIRIHTSTA